MAGETYNFRENHCGADSWTDGKDCKAWVEDGWVFVEPRKIDRPWDRRFSVPLCGLKERVENIGAVPKVTDRGVDLGTVPAAAEAPGGGRRGRTPGAALKE